MNIDFQELANKYQTPYYVYDFDYITKQYEELKSAFRARKSLIAYAVKANSNLSAQPKRVEVSLAPHIESKIPALALVYDIIFQSIAIFSLLNLIIYSADSLSESSISLDFNSAFFF